MLLARCATTTSRLHELRGAERARTWRHGAVRRATTGGVGARRLLAAPSRANAKRSGAEVQLLEEAVSQLKRISAFTEAAAQQPPEADELQMLQEEEVQEVAQLLELFRMHALAARMESLMARQREVARTLQWAMANAEVGQFAYWDSQQMGLPRCSAELVRDVLMTFMKGKGRTIPATYFLKFDPHAEQGAGEAPEEWEDDDEGGLEDLMAAAAGQAAAGVSTGARVRIKASAHEPGLGSVPADSVGVVVGMLPDGHSCLVQFPEEPRWVGPVEELEVVQPADAARMDGRVSSDSKEASEHEAFRSALVQQIYGLTGVEPRIAKRTVQGADVHVIFRV